MMKMLLYMLPGEASWQPLRAGFQASFSDIHPGYTSRGADLKA
jgi:hypothetical protein